MIRQHVQHESGVTFTVLEYNIIYFLGPSSEATVPEASYRSAFEADFIRSKLLQALEKIELAQKLGNWPPRGATKRRLSPLSPNFELAEGKEPIQPRKLPAGLSTAISKEELEKVNSRITMN